MAKSGVSAVAVNDTSPRASRSRRFIVALTMRECDLVAAYGMGVGKSESVYFIRPAGAAEAKARRPAFMRGRKADHLACPLIIAAAPTSARRAASGTGSVRAA